VWFCVAAAVIAAAVADPVVEFASNSLMFGSGVFTDQSNLDVLPALFLGCAFVVLCVVLRVRRVLGGGAPSPEFLRTSQRALNGRIVPLLPVILTLQLMALFAMETLEQYVTLGHGLGGTIWLGGPPPISIAIHVVACVAVTFSIARIVRMLAQATLRVVRFVRAVARIARRSVSPILYRVADVVALRLALFARSSTGERAPPLQA
jgi:hypothetical protein